MIILRSIRPENVRAQYIGRDNIGVVTDRTTVEVKGETIEVLSVTFDTHTISAPTRFFRLVSDL